MTTRREVVGMLGSASLAGLLGPQRVLALQGEATPPLAPGTPQSEQRLALIAATRTKFEGIDQLFEPRTHKGGWDMPYRLFRPKASGKLPLVVYLHGSGGLGNDNVKQMGAGNIFGTRVWAMQENQARFPCYVLAPQTDRGWVRYGDPAPGDSVSQPIRGLGEGARLAFELIDALSRELPIDGRRIYLTGQSMGGAGAWHFLAERPNFFAAAAICCGSPSPDSVDGIRTPIWNFHGIDDEVVPVSASRERITALRKAGGRPFHTEYAGVGHNVWQWAYTEPELFKWIFSKGR